MRGAPIVGSDESMSAGIDERAVVATQERQGVEAARHPYAGRKQYLGDASALRWRTKHVLPEREGDVAPEHDRPEPRGRDQRFTSDESE